MEITLLVTFAAKFCAARKVQLRAILLRNVCKLCIFDSIDADIDVLYEKL